MNNKYSHRSHSHFHIFNMILFVLLSLLLPIIYVVAEESYSSENAAFVRHHPNAKISLALDTEKKRGPIVGYKAISTMKKEIEDKQEVGLSDLVRNEAATIAAQSPGSLNIGQICAIYRNLTGRWAYVDDPRGLDYFQYANQTMVLGKRSNPPRSGIGDCDDFSILISSMIESIGGATRIILAKDNVSNNDHMCAEVFLGNHDRDNESLENIIEYLRIIYTRPEIGFDISKPSTDEVWLALDGNTNCPGVSSWKGNPSMPIILRSSSIRPIVRTADAKDAINLNGLIIQSPSAGQTVGNEVEISGNVSSMPIKGERLWIAVSPCNDPSSWWPQLGGPINPSQDTGSFLGKAYLGGSPKDRFRIAILKVNDTLNSKIERYVHECQNGSRWPSITGEGIIPEATIESSIADEVTVSLSDVIIRSPFEGQTVKGKVTIEGDVLSLPESGEHFWIAVNPYTDPSSWWPQSGGPIVPSRVTRAFLGMAYLSGSPKDRFRIAILKVNDTLNSKIERYVHECQNGSRWPSITGENIVSREAIESNVSDEVTVRL
jgi:hypothetical protein